MGVRFKGSRVLFRKIGGLWKVAFDQDCCCRSCVNVMTGATIVRLEFDEPTGAGGCDAYTLLRTAGVSPLDPEPNACSFWGQDPPANSVVTCTVTRPPPDPPTYFYLERILDANFGQVAGACPNPAMRNRIEFNTLVNAYVPCTYGGVTYCRACGKNVSGGVCLSDEDWATFLDEKEITIGGCVWNTTAPDATCSLYGAVANTGTCSVKVSIE